MLKKEFKDNFKSFLIWTTVLIVIFLIVYSVYPFIITDDTVKNLDEMMKVFPKELLKSFNMDITTINTAYGWLKSEGFMFVYLIVGFYSSLLGLQILLKEENDKTIEYLISLPIKRNIIVRNKIVVSVIYIFSMIFLLGVFNYIGLSLSGSFNQKEFLLISITPLFVAYPLFAFNLFLSVFLHRTKKTLGISLGLVFFFYIINILSELSTKIDGIKYFSIYTLADIRNVISKCSINPICIVISCTITILFITLTYLFYQKKELI